MEKAINPDLDEYLTLFRVQTPTEPVTHYEDGELEAKWLAAAGYSDLTKHFEEGREVPTAELESVLSGLPPRHVKAIKHRVKALNQTVRGRNRSRYKKKTDIRDVFKDVDDSSTGTRSRSATPDSLDSTHDEQTWKSARLLLDGNTPTTSSRTKQKLKRTPSAPHRASAEIFRGAQVRCDIPFYTSKGIELLNFQRIGTHHIPRIRSGSESSCSPTPKENHLTASRSHEDLISDINLSVNLSNDQALEINARVEKSVPSADVISFENLVKETGSKRGQQKVLEEPSCDVNSINEVEFNKLKPLLWLELAAIFDKHNVTLDKRKPFKRKRKEEGNLFGVSLNALIRRDQQITGELSSLVPLFLQGLLDELRRRGAKEEGILRVPGNKQKTESLYNELELIFYQKPNRVASLLSEANAHDLSTLLKRWLRELPQPLLANDLIHLYYQTHQLTVSDQCSALSMLCLLLPDENRNTLRAILVFLNYIIERQTWNKMTLDNIATIAAPSFFPPKFIHPTNKNSIEAQVRMAAMCYTLTKLLISLGESLFRVPSRLLDELQSLRREHKTKVKSSNEEQTVQTNIVNPDHVYRLAV